jgi:hypothetical protein
MKMMSKPFVKIVVVSLSMLVGCDKVGSQPESSNTPASSLSMDMPPPATVEIHAHPSEGPHHGSLVELGKEEFHAELVHDSKSVTIYILDSDAKAAVPIDSPELVINIVHDGKPEQFKLTAVPDDGDPSGRSSRFVSNDTELASHVDDEKALPKLSVSINGKPYRGVISHNHSGHDHAH